MKRLFPPLAAVLFAAGLLGSILGLVNDFIGILMILPGFGYYAVFAWKKGLL